MITVRYFRQAGKCHDYDLEKCQDHISIVSEANRTTIVLCDGAGSSPYGGEAARITADVLGKHLHENFKKYLYDSIPDIKRRLTQVVDNELIQAAKKININPGLLATTILAVCMDDEGKFIGVHLGDGFILWDVRGEDGLQTVSSPQRGYLPSSTYLTMNCPLFYYMRFYRWPKPEAKRIILLSDGMDCLHKDFNQDTFSQQNQKLLQEKMSAAKSFDDMSYILCELE